MEIKLISYRMLCEQFEFEFWKPDDKEGFYKHLNNLKEQTKEINKIVDDEYLMDLSIAWSNAEKRHGRNY